MCGGNLTGERVIHASIFILLLVGLTVLTAYLSYTYLQKNLILVVGAIPLAWGIILLAMYLGFKKADWKWWS
jgi:hypothetical protein